MFGLRKAAPIAVTPSTPVFAFKELPPAAFAFNKAQRDVLDSLPADENGMVFIGDIVRHIVGEQTQYISRHFDGSCNTIILTDGLRTDIDASSYHSFKLHKDDAELFIARLRAYRWSNHRNCH